MLHQQHLNVKGVALIYYIERKFSDKRTSLSIHALHMPIPSRFVIQIIFLHRRKPTNKINSGVFNMKKIFLSVMIALAIFPSLTHSENIHFWFKYHCARW